MPKSKPPQSYRDDPDAVSLHTTPDEYHDGPSQSGSDALPSYSDSEGIAETERGNHERAARVRDNVDVYNWIQLSGEDGWVTERLGGKKTSSKEVSARMDTRLSDPDTLFEYVNDYQQWVKPAPAVCIAGFHWQTTRNGDKKEKQRVTDFEFTFSLQPFLADPNDSEWRTPRVVTNGEKAYRGTWRKTRAPGVASDLEVGGPEEKDLQAWVKDYCENPSNLKIFRVSRTISGLDTEYLKNAIEGLIRSTNYRGHVNVQVIIENRAVDVYSNHWINAWRNGWQRYLFYLTFLFIFTWPVLFFLTKRWHIFTVDWVFSMPWPERGANARRYATISEEEWYTRHKVLMRELILDHFTGDATSLPRDRARTERTRQPSTGNANIDSAVNLIQAGVGGWNALQRGLGRDTEGWGHDC